MVKVIKKPLEVEARRFNGGVEDAIQITEWLAGFDKRVDYKLEMNSYIYSDSPMEIKTNQRLFLTDQHGYNGDTVTVGDWIVQMSDGEFKSLSQSEFEREYEEVSE